MEGEVVVQKVLGTSFETGYNAMDDRIEDLVAAGVIDPAKVEISCTRSGSLAGADGLPAFACSAAAGGGG